MPPREELYDEYVNQEKSFSQLSHKYGVAISTLSKWCRIYEIPTRIQQKAQIKKIGGVDHRQCWGPDHNGAWVPMSKFHKNPGKALGTRPRCAACSGTPQQVNFTPTYQAWLKSIVNRIGLAEAHRRLGVSERTIRTWMGKERTRQIPATIRRKHAIEIAKLLAQLKLTQEVRHRKSIKRGATKRGEAEREITSPKDYYKPHGDLDTEQARRRRSAQSEAA